MNYIIMGYDKRFASRRKAKEYARFDNRAECSRYLNKLKTGCLADTTAFFIQEVFSHGSD